jgi:hypothetical protein
LNLAYTTYHYPGVWQCGIPIKCLDDFRANNEFLEYIFIFRQFSQSNKEQKLLKLFVLAQFFIAFQIRVFLESLVPILGS